MLLISPQNEIYLYLKCIYHINCSTLVNFNFSFLAFLADVDL